MDDQQLTPAPRVRQSKWDIDARRARALHGDPLEELTEKQREWIWRSLPKGIRLKEATRLAQMTPQAVARRWIEWPASIRPPSPSSGPFAVRRYAGGRPQA